MFCFFFVFVVFLSLSLSGSIMHAVLIYECMMSDCSESTWLEQLKEQRIGRLGTVTFRFWVRMCNNLHTFIHPL